MRARNCDYVLVFFGQSLGGFEPALGGQDGDWHFAGCRIYSKLVEHFANVGRDDVHIDEDCFDVGRIAGHREEFAAIVRGFGGELLRGELAGQLGCCGTGRHRDESSALVAATGEPSERFGNAARAGIGRGSDRVP